MYCKARQELDDTLNRYKEGSEAPSGSTTSSTKDTKASGGDGTAANGSNDTTNKKKTSLEDVKEKLDTAMLAGNACKVALSRALDAFNNISEVLEHSLEKAYGDFFAAGARCFARSEGGNAPESSGAHGQPTVMQTFLEDFVDLQISHMNLLSSLAELGNGVDLPRSDTDLLFGPLSTLLAVHSQMYTTLDKLLKTRASRQEAEIAHEAIATLQTALPVMDNCYQRFIQSESAALALFKHHKAATFAFNVKLKRFPPSYDFVSSRTCSLKHLSRYEAMLCPWIEQYDGGKEVLRQYRELMRRCNDAHARSEAVVPLLKLREQFVGFDDVLDFYRALVCDGPARVVPPDSATDAAAAGSVATDSGLNTGDTYHVFIFSDCWVIAAETPSNLYYLTRGDLITELRIMPVALAASSSSPSSPSSSQELLLRLAWKGPKINLRAMMEERVADEADRLALKRRDGNAALAAMYDTSKPDAAHEHTVFVRFASSNPQHSAERVRAMILEASQRRMQTRVFGVDL